MLLLAFILSTWSGPHTELSGWFESLQSPGGGYCCAKADGREAQWGTSGTHYTVEVEGRTRVVPDDKVVRGPNLYGRALVWLRPDGEIRCFMPGGGT